MELYCYFCTLTVNVKIKYMEVKNSPAADLENKRLTNMLIGFILAFALLFVAFEFTQRDEKDNVKESMLDNSIEEDIIPITQQQEMLTPPKASPKAAEMLNVVDNNTNVDKTEIVNTESNPTSVTGDGAAATAEQTTTDATNDVDAADDSKIFQIVEQLPEFPGGMVEFMKWLTKNLRYPAYAQKNAIQGKVIIQFVINKDGSVVDANIVHSLEPSCDKEAMRVIKMMPKWHPGLEHNKPVRVRYTIPIIFKL